MAIGAVEIVFVLFVIAVPIALLALLFVYLKRTAPEGTVLAGATPAAAPKAPAAPSDLQGPGSRVTGARKCPSCGMIVTAAQIGGLTPRCQNCNTMLTPA